MSQDSYDAGYRDGRQSREEEVASLKLLYHEARGDLERARAEAQRLRGIVHRAPALHDDCQF